MKKFLSLLFFTVLLLCTTACSHNAERDLSVLEEYTSGELRALMEDAREVADSRFDDMGPDLAEALVENMQGLGYPLEITSVENNDIRFALEDNPSVEFMMFHHTKWYLYISEDITLDFLTDCLGSMAKALSDEEGHPDAKDDVESYIRIFEDALPIELLAPRQSCTCYYDGYVYTAVKNSDSGYVLLIE